MARLTHRPSAGPAQALRRHCTWVLQALHRPCGCPLQALWLGGATSTWKPAIAWLKLWRLEGAGWRPQAGGHRLQVYQIQYMSKNMHTTKNQNTTWLWSSQWGINYYDNQNKQKADYHPDNILVTLIIFLSEHTPLSTIQPMGKMFYFDQWRKSECHT